MDLEAGPLCEPESNLGMLVGGVLVDDQMNIKACRSSLIDALEELKKIPDDDGGPCTPSDHDEGEGHVVEPSSEASKRS